MGPFLKNQNQVSPFRAMPVDDKGSASSITTVSGETVQFYYNNAGTLTSDAGQVAGTVVVGQLAYDNIKNLLGNMEAVNGDTSLTFTCAAMTAEVKFDMPFFEMLDETTIFNRMAAIGATLTSGQYCVDYTNGTIYVKKATTASTMTSVGYKYKSSATSSAGGSTTVTGNAASGATDSGNPVKVGLVYNSTKPTVTNGQRVDAQGTNRGELQVAEQYVDQFVDNSNGVAATAVKPLAVATYSYTLFQNLGANATLNVKATPGNVYSLYCHNVSGGVRYLQLHNSATTSSGAPLHTFLVPAGGTLILDSAYFGPLGLNFSTGIAFGFSTTEATYTAATATDHITQIQYK